MRRLFIIRKDLKLSSGKLAAMVGHCAEAYWLNLIRRNTKDYVCSVELDKEMYDNYVNGKIVKTICEAKNLNNLLKAKNKALELGLKEEIDFGLINDCCLTELKPENENGTCTVGIWFAPLEDDLAHLISKPYQLYHDSPKNDLRASESVIGAFQDNSLSDFVCCNDESIEQLVKASLKSINDELERLYWNKNQKELNSPFENTGNNYSNDYLSIRAFYWGDDESLRGLPNFETPNIKVSWYKHLGRGDSIYIKKCDNPYKLIANDLAKCLESLKKDFK